MLDKKTVTSIVECYPALVCRDLPLLTDAATVSASFNALPKEANGFPANETLQAFVAANFGAAGSDFESAVPDDFSAEPEDFLPNVTDPAIRQWALQVNDLWQDLCREVRLPPLSGTIYRERRKKGRGEGCFREVQIRHKRGMEAGERGEGVPAKCHRWGGFARCPNWLVDSYTLCCMHTSANQDQMQRKLQRPPQLPFFTLVCFESSPLQSILRAKLPSCAPVCYTCSRTSGSNDTDTAEFSF